MNTPSPIITLTNGKKVANFSSPHSFTFIDGSVLPAHDAEWAEQYKIKFIETDCGDGDVELSFKLASVAIDNLMAKWQKIWHDRVVDVVYVPLPMLQAMINHPAWKHRLKASPFRAVRIEDRVKKLLSIEKQTIMGVGLM